MHVIWKTEMTEGEEKGEGWEKGREKEDGRERGREKERERQRDFLSQSLPTWPHVLEWGCSEAKHWEFLPHLARECRGLSNGPSFAAFPGTWAGDLHQKWGSWGPNQCLYRFLAKQASALHATTPCRQHCVFKSPPSGWTHRSLRVLGPRFLGRIMGDFFISVCF